MEARINMEFEYCKICEEELEENDPGIDKWHEDFIVREMICSNKNCPIFEKQQDWFFDFTRIDIDGDEIDEEELKKEFAKKSGEERK
jgi:hypothetical protein